jgi:hypothetical protein
LVPLSLASAAPYDPKIRSQSFIDMYISLAMGTLLLFF